jgi:Holliday junction resolvase
MRQPSEKSIERAVIAEAKRLGWWSLKLHGGPYQTAGLPDVLVIKGGRAAWMEIKRPGEDPTRLQNHRMRELIEAGSPCTVVRSVGDAKAFLEVVDESG